MNVNTYQHIDLAYMDMMSDGDDSMKQIMLGMLIEELPLEIQKMEQLLTTEDWDGLSAVSHKMKSTLAFVGNEEMTQADKTIEHLTKTIPSIDEVNNLISVLTRLSPSVMQELKEEQSRL